MKNVLESLQARRPYPLAEVRVHPAPLVVSAAVSNKPRQNKVKDLLQKTRALLAQGGVHMQYTNP